MKFLHFLEKSTDKFFLYIFDRIKNGIYIYWIEKTSKRKVINLENNFWKALSKDAYPVSKGKIRIPISLEPFVISKNKYNFLQKNLLLLISAARKVANKYFVDKQIQEVLSLNQNEKALIENSKNEDFLGVVRVDLFYNKKPQVVEINADFPDGLFMHDVTSRTISKFLKKDIEIPNHADIFNRLLLSQGIKHSDNIFIGFNKERKFIDEFELSKNKLKQLGWESVSVGAFEDLGFKNGKFIFEGKIVDVIRRGTELFKLRKMPGFLDKLVKVQNTSKLKVINNFKMRLLGHKSLMAVLHDKRFYKYLTHQEIRAIKLLLPKTLKLENCDIKKVLHNKDIWVLKPSDLAEGEGVSVGKSISLMDWKIALKNALKNPKYWILQKKISIPRRKFNLVDVNRELIITGVKKYDFCPHIFLFKKHNEMGSILVRFSESDILNVMKGGGLTYAFVR